MIRNPSNFTSYKKSGSSNGSFIRVHNIGFIPDKNFDFFPFFISAAISFSSMFSLSVAVFSLLGSAFFARLLCHSFSGFAFTCSNVLFDKTDFSFLVISSAVAYLSFFFINSHALSPRSFVFTNENAPFNLSPCKTKEMLPWYRWCIKDFSSSFFPPVHKFLHPKQSPFRHHNLRE